MRRPRPGSWLRPPARTGVGCDGAWPEIRDWRIRCAVRDVTTRRLVLERVTHRGHRALEPSGTYEPLSGCEVPNPIWSRPDFEVRSALFHVERLHRLFHLFRGHVGSRL